LNFLDTFSNNTQISNFTKIHPVGAEFHMRTDGRTKRTERTTPIVAFRNYANAPKKRKAFRPTQTPTPWTPAALSPRLTF